MLCYCLDGPLFLAAPTRVTTKLLVWTLGAFVVLTRLHSVALSGIDGIACEVEVDVTSRGLPQSVLVGLPDQTTKESLERIRAALTNCGYQWPRHRTVINLAPADLKKEGSAFDLPIALGMVIADGQIMSDALDAFLVAGELALDGRVRSVKGVLSMAVLAKSKGFDRMIVPAANAPEAAVVDGLHVFPVTSLTQAVGLIAGQLELQPAQVDLDKVFAEAGTYDVDFADVRGQEHIKRAMTIAAAGHHNMLMIGPPGTGKTMLAKRLPTILPPLTWAESLETTRIYSSLGLLKDGQALVATRPVRAPHSSTSSAALVGGGTIPTPGELSLAHHGVLFLDEFPQFTRSVLETIRQPLEDGQVTVSRVHSAVTFPAQIMLIASMNPCPCGYLGDPKRTCKCSPLQIQRYRGRISGPLADRIDIHIEVPAVAYRKLRSAQAGISSAQMREAVSAALERQKERFGSDSTITNSRMTSRAIRKYCPLDSVCETLLKQAMDELGLSARAHDKVLKLARTIADIADSTQITPEHLSEAIQYRLLDRTV